MIQTHTTIRRTQSTQQAPEQKNQNQPEDLPTENSSDVFSRASQVSQGLASTVRSGIQRLSQGLEAPKGSTPTAQARSTPVRYPALNLRADVVETLQPGFSRLPEGIQDQYRDAIVAIYNPKASQADRQSAAAVIRSHGPINNDTFTPDFEALTEFYSDQLTDVGVPQAQATQQAESIVKRFKRADARAKKDSSC